MKESFRSFVLLWSTLLMLTVAAETAPAQSGRPAGGPQSPEQMKQNMSRPSRSGSQIRGNQSPGGIVVAASNTAACIQWIDVHSHLVGPKQNVAGAVSAAAAVIDQFGMTRMIIMPTPHDGVKVRGADCENFPSAIRQYGSRFAFLGGGGSLNPMIQQAAGQTGVSDKLRRQFEDQAETILQMGAAGFGEMAVRHLSLQGSEHPYESVSADHPLYLLLSDIAAKHDVPIDIHLDVTTNDIPTPEWLTSPNNPKILPENLAAFERLLDHNPKTKICWEHLGSDNTGHWTADLSRRMLTKHSNLYMALRLGPGMSVTERQGRRVPVNFPLTPDGRIIPEWLQLFKDFSTRFMIGDDGFIASASGRATGVGGQLSSKVPASRSNVQTFLNALPADVAQKVAVENATAFYKLGK